MIETTSAHQIASVLYWVERSWNMGAPCVPESLLGEEPGASVSDSKCEPEIKHLCCGKCLMFGVYLWPLASLTSSDPVAEASGAHQHWSTPSPLQVGWGQVAGFCNALLWDVWATWSKAIITWEWTFSNGSLYSPQLGTNHSFPAVQLMDIEHILNKTKCFLWNIDESCVGCLWLRTTIC